MDAAVWMGRVFIRGTTDGLPWRRPVLSTDPGGGGRVSSPELSQPSWRVIFLSERPIYSAGAVSGPAPLIRPTGIGPYTIASGISYIFSLVKTPKSTRNYCICSEMNRNLGSLHFLKTVYNTCFVKYKCRFTANGPFKRIFRTRL